MDFTLKYIKTPQIVYILFHFKNINTTLNLYDTYPCRHFLKN